MMPEQDGFSFLKELREMNIMTPVILLSGREEDAVQVQGLGLGADDYMTKPFSKVILVSKYGQSSDGPSNTHLLLLQLSAPCYSVDVSHYI